MRLRAPAREGKANAELARLLAAKLGVRAGDVRLRAGARGRRKTVHVRGVDVATARARLES